MTTEPEEIDAFIKAALVRNIERCGLKKEVMALLMGITAPQLSAQLRPGGHVSISRLLRVAADPDGERALQLFWVEIGDYLGLENVDAIAAELQRFQGRLLWLTQRIQVRMARAELRQVEAERRSA